MKTQATDRPWKLTQNKYRCVIHRPDCRIILTEREPIILNETWNKIIEDHRLIVKAVNNHDELVSCVTHALLLINNYEQSGASKELVERINIVLADVSKEE